MTTLTPAQIAAVAYAAGFRGTGLQRAVAVALAESGGRADVISKPNADRWRSRDRGLWQLNDHWHPEVSTADALNPAKAAAAVFKISKGGTDWRQWSTWQTGTAQAQLGRAALAVGSAQAAGFTLPVPGLPFGVPVPDLPGLPGSGVEGIPNPLTGVVDVAGALSSVARSMAAIASGYVKAGAWLADRHNMARVGMVTLGGAGVLAGLVLLSRTDTGGPVGAAARGTVNGARRAAKGTAQLGAAIATDGATAAAQGAAKAAKGAARATA